jgi:uncharacterized protein (TIGR00369 family)
MSTDGETETQRVLTAMWEDPQICVKRGGSMSGLDFLGRIKTGEIPPPPVAKLVGYRLSEVEEGHAVFELEPAEQHYNPFGTVHGGILSTLLDTSMIAAVMTTLSTGAACSTLEIKVNFIRPATIGTGTLRCEARTIHLGRRIATAEGRIFDGEGALYAHAVSTVLIFSTGKKG